MDQVGSNIQVSHLACAQQGAWQKRLEVQVYEQACNWSFTYLENVKLALPWKRRISSWVARCSKMANREFFEHLRP